MHGFGWLPSQDVPPSGWPAPPAPAQRCIKLLESKGIKLQAAADYQFAFNGCEALFAYETALKATGGRSDGPLVVAALEALGTSYTGVMNLDGRMSLSRTQHDAPTFARYFSFDSSCTCFVYRPATLTIR